MDWDTLGAVAENVFSATANNNIDFEYLYVQVHPNLSSQICLTFWLWIQNNINREENTYQTGLLDTFIVH